MQRQTRAGFNTRERFSKDERPQALERSFNEALAAAIALTKVHGCFVGDTGDIGWDAIEDEANANVSKGLEDAFVTWDAAAWQTRIGLRDIQDVVDELEPAMDAWHRNASWRLGNLSRAFMDFRDLNGNLTGNLNGGPKGYLKGNLNGEPQPVS